MGMDLSQGGHLTHGSPVNMSGKNYNFVSYGVSAEDGRIDYAALAKQVAKVRPKLIVAGASAYPRAIDFEKLAEIAHELRRDADGRYGAHCGSCRSAASTRAPCPTPTWSPPRPTRRCAAPAAA